jgi:hypothetical protein
MMIDAKRYGIYRRRVFCGGISWWICVSTLSMDDSKGSSCYFGTWKKPNFELA